MFLYSLDFCLYFWFWLDFKFWLHGHSVILFSKIIIHFMNWRDSEVLLFMPWFLWNSFGDYVFWKKQVIFPIYLANFCVSGVATQWYFYRKNRPDQIRVERSFLNLFKFHWGSVLGCAFLTATLYIFDYILDFFLVLYLNNTEQWYSC